MAMWNSFGRTDYCEF